MSEDDLRHILGEDLFNELESIDPEEIELELVDAIELPQEVIDRIGATEYRVTIPLAGDVLLDVVAALFHAAEQDCANCTKFVTEMAIRMIAQLWVDVMQTEGIIPPKDE